jgi:hypothetical protein
VDILDDDTVELIAHSSFMSVLVPTAMIICVGSFQVDAIIIRNSLTMSVFPIGEKYRGYFDRDFRHGQGICVYKNKSRYAGEWYRGVHEGV